jgi:hypothetical protein
MSLSEEPVTTWLFGMIFGFPILIGWIILAISITYILHTIFGSIGVIIGLLSLTIIIGNYLLHYKTKKKNETSSFISKEEAKKQ